LFIQDDFWQIFKYLFESRQGGDVPELDSTIKTISDSDRAKTTYLFENTIDQVCFNTQDYQRIRSFLIDWYSSFKTQVSLQKDFQDPFALPGEYLNELIRSFGYPYPGDIASVNIRANFFLDLVNLYKIKGTPEGLKSALDYYGLRNVDFAEYWLQKNKEGQLAFKGVSIFPPVYTFTWPDVEFEAASLDPHWFQTEQDIIQLLDRNIIALPSKTPYFGLRPFFSLAEVQQTIAILVRTVDDQYKKWQADLTLQRDLKLELLNVTVSILETYLACCHIVNSSYDYQEPIIYTPGSYICYDGTSTVTIDIVAQYEALTAYPAYNPDDPEGEIAFRALRVAQFNALFTRPIAQNFIQGKTGVNSPGEILNTINPTFKATVDAWISSGNYLEILASFLEALSGWVRVHINTNASDIISIVLGISSSPAVARIINFFKPYRARLLATQFYYVIDNPLFDFVRIYDRNFYLKVQENFYDYATANSLSCCGGDETSCSDVEIIEPLLYSRETYDCGSYHDIGIVWDQQPQICEVIYLEDSLNCHRSNSTSEYWYEVSPGFDGTTDAEVIVTGGFRDFDSGWVFDCPGGSDIVNIFLDTGGYGSGYYGAGYYGDIFHY